jgi:hypothetical protein
MTKKQIILLAIVVVLPVFLGCLQFIDEDLIKKQEDGILRHIYIVSYSYKLPIALIGGFIVSLSALTKDLYAPRKQFKDIRILIMKTMLDESFNGAKEHVRITIFKDTRWLVVLYHYYKDFCRHPLEKRAARPKLGKYIMATERVGTENPYSKACFYFSPKSARFSQGIAGKVRQKESELVASNLPDISDLNLHEVNFRDERNPITLRVKEYMKLGHIDDIETLKRLHIKARHFYGNVLYNKSGDPTGVLVIDDTRENNPFDDATVTKLAHYLKLFSPTM